MGMPDQAGMRACSSHLRTAVHSLFFPPALPFLLQLSDAQKKQIRTLLST